MKKITLFIVILGVVAGSFFYWWQNQSDVRELNKNSPEGIKVVKSLVGNEYRIVNEIDGYEFKVPTEWEGIKGIEYIPEREEMGYKGTSINLRGREKGLIGVDKFISGGNMDADLESWAEAEFNTFGLVGDFIKDKVKRIEIVKTQENIHFGGEYVYYFKKDQTVYSITSPSEEFIQYIITNGRW